MKRVNPGGTVGILGGGQLAQMMAAQARELGYRVAVLDPNPRCPARDVADIVITASLADEQAAAERAHHSDVITLDTEHVPAGILEAVQPLTLVRPSAAILRCIQDRLTQRHFLESEGAAQPGFLSIACEEEVRYAERHASFPAVLKTRRAGYDGKGQVRVHSPGELASAWESIGKTPAVLEQFVHFEREISVVLARSLDGAVDFYPIAENKHRDHILWKTTAPARVEPRVAARARDVAARLAAALDYCGVLAVEFFVSTDGELLVNELAPRVHNSGHFTSEACVTSQFKQHILAITGQTLGSCRAVKPAIMLNVLGELWLDSGKLRWLRSLVDHPSVTLHLYGKDEPRPGRKMGHLVLTPDSGSTDLELISERIEEELLRPPTQRAVPTTHAAALSLISGLHWG